MLKIFFVVAAIITLSLLTSCESDKVTNGSTERKLILSPTSLEGELYTEYTFNARVTNLAASDVIFFWDFDDGHGSREFGREETQRYTFYQPKVHFVRVQAVDYVTGEELGYDSIRADIRPPARSVTISPKMVDTTLTMLSTGSLRDSIPFTLKTSTPDHLVRVEWNFGDGSPVRQTQHQLQHTIWHKFVANGNFRVVAKAFDTAGVFLGSDTAHVTLRYLPLTFDDLAACRAISVYLSIDNSDSAFTHPLFRNPFAMKLQIKEDHVNNKLFNNNLFTITYDSIASNLSRKNSAFGEFGPDIHSIKWIQVSVSDTGKLNKKEPTYGGVDYSYRLNDLKLLAITATKVVYRVEGLKLSDFAQNIQFRATGLLLVPSGILDNVPASRTPVEGLPGIFGLVVFDR